MKKGRALGYLTFTLHAHLPWVVHHGTWPHGLEWLMEAAAEAYLPLLRVLRNLDRDGLALRANINFSPVLLEQLAHPTFQSEFPEYLKRKMLSAQEDETYFRHSGDEHFARTACQWHEVFKQAANDFEALDRDIIGGFRYFNDAGLIEIITCCATHSYLPLLGTDESVVAQLRTGVAAHQRHLGREPRGIWIPECGYRPAGHWQMPVAPHGATTPWPPVQRIGVEQALAEAGLSYFFADTCQVEQARPCTPAGQPLLRGAEAAPARGDRTLPARYRPWFVDGPCAHTRPVAVFPRDPRTGRQVWSSDYGYPGDPNYLDFYKKRWPGGHRYWQVTESKADMALKTAWSPDRAAARTRAHAEHFVSIVYESLKDSVSEDYPPVLSSLFDAELFGHWWFEGPQWLEQVARIVARDDFPIALTTASQYLDEHRPEGFLKLSEGSWGRNGNNDAWLNENTAWTWSRIYPAEERVRALVTEARWQDGASGERIVKQLCRELLLLESSDWQFLITTEAARDYAEQRFTRHLDYFETLDRIWEELQSTGGMSAGSEEQLRLIERQDSLFAEIDPNAWRRRQPGC